MQSAFTATATTSPIAIMITWVLRLYRPETRSMALLYQPSMLAWIFLTSPSADFSNDSKAVLTLSGSAGGVPPALVADHCSLTFMIARAKFCVGIYDGRFFERGEYLPRYRLLTRP